MDIQQALTDAAAAAMATTEVAPVDEVPQEVAEPQDEVAEVETEAEAPDAEPETEEPAADPALPEGYVAVPVVEDKLATEFTLRDAEGEVEIPALMVEYKANGKVRKDRLDQVVKLAQFGVYNESREQQYKHVESRAQELEQTLLEREAQMERLLKDDDFFLSLREAYERENSPERRAERAEQRVQDVQMETQMHSIQTAGEQFYSSEVRPAVELIASALPSVTTEELEDRIAYAMQLHAKAAPNGKTYLPVSEYAALRQYIVEDLSVWAQMTHARRSPPATTPKLEQAQAAAAKAQVEAQKAKRVVGQATKPVGRASSTPAKPKAAKPATVDDALDSAMSEILSSFR
jgi:hypothetical protein